ncbi:hypothetical protein F5Y07DRAFT_363923 [Xylaria sp. FL0933]|nr:hypothetical protein F5Y07DRAFT_363923 [Xylaria sp. FL0933]
MRILLSLLLSSREVFGLIHQEPLYVNASTSYKATVTSLKVICISIVHNPNDESICPVISPRPFIYIHQEDEE